MVSNVEVLLQNPRGKSRLVELESGRPNLVSSIISGRPRGVGTRCLRMVRITGSFSIRSPQTRAILLASSTFSVPTISQVFLSWFLKQTRSSIAINYYRQGAKRETLRDRKKPDQGTSLSPLFGSRAHANWYATESLSRLKLYRYTKAKRWLPRSIRLVLFPLFRHSGHFSVVTRMQDKRSYLAFSKSGRRPGARSLN